jgi:hypothetical protein
MWFKPAELNDNDRPEAKKPQYITAHSWVSPLAPFAGSVNLFALAATNERP